MTSIQAIWDVALGGMGGSGAQRILGGDGGDGGMGFGGGFFIGSAILDIFSSMIHFNRATGGGAGAGTLLGHPGAQGSGIGGGLYLAAPGSGQKNTVITGDSASTSNPDIFGSLGNL
jgi:hypothetical protein